MRKIEFVRMPAFVVGSTPTSGNYAALTYASDGTSVTVRLLEDAAGAAGTALGQEKTNAEAYVTGQAFRAEFVGY